jgi:hypothetical protein
MDFISSSEPENIKKVFLIHGELPQLEAMKKSVQQLGIQEVYTPALGESFSL